MGVIAKVFLAFTSTHYLINNDDEDSRGDDSGTSTACLNRKARFSYARAWEVASHVSGLKTDEDHNVSSLLSSLRQGKKRSRDGRILEERICEVLSKDLSTAPPCPQILLEWDTTDRRSMTIDEDDEDFEVLKKYLDERTLGNSKDTEGIGFDYDNRNAIAPVEKNV